MGKSYNIEGPRSAPPLDRHLQHQTYCSILSMDWFKGTIYRKAAYFMGKIDGFRFRCSIHFTKFKQDSGVAKTMNHHEPVFVAALRIEHLRSKKMKPAWSSPKKTNGPHRWVLQLEAVVLLIFTLGTGDAVQWILQVSQHIITDDKTSSFNLSLPYFHIEYPQYWVPPFSKHQV